MTRKFSGEDLILATHNRGKLAEFQKLFGERSFKFSCAADHGLPEPEETGTTFLENATTKALAAAKATGKPSMADDSGLCVVALNGDPGVYSADWAEKEDGTRDFDTAMAVVHEKLGKAKDRRAAFVCCLVLAFSDGHVEHVQASAEGTVIWPPQGKSSIGYDAIFQPIGHTKSYAELAGEEKNIISHRSKAFNLMMEKCF